MSRNITFYWRKPSRQLKRKKKGAETLYISSTTAPKSSGCPRLFSVSHNPCFHHRRPMQHASYITAAPTSLCCDWLMIRQRSQTAAETQTTMFPPQSRKTQGSSQSIQIPAAFWGALSISQWEEREIPLFTGHYLQKFNDLYPSSKPNIKFMWAFAKS